MKIGLAVNDKNKKIPRGYRLKASTHKKIKEIQLLINGSQEKVISGALRVYIQKLNKIQK